ncbi:MAG TPA: PD-(D/E)XK nuclease family protein [Nocardioidaceae bacterium]|nr:PD-(D/E)XK nuclease family protein [Nocardioidaceae bacterium]
MSIDLGQKAEDNASEQPDDMRLWSVTSLIGCLDKPALLYWAAEQAAQAAVSVANSLPTRIEEDGEAEVVKWLRDARFRRPKGRLSNASLGTVAHAACEEYAMTGVRPDDGRVAELIRQEGGARFDGIEAESKVIAKMLDQFDDWLQRFQPSYQATEVTVYSPTYGYAGTCDGFLTIDGVRLIIDYKTSREGFDGRGQAKTPYPEAALQLAAYRHAEYAAVWRPRRIEKFRRRYYLLSDAERDRAVPVPEVDAGAVIHLTPDHCEAFATRCDEKVHEAFLYIIEASRWVNGLSRDVIGLPIVPTRRAVAS